MMLRRIIILAALPLIAVVSLAAETHCKAKPEECARQIREFLEGKKYLGVTLVMTRLGPVVKSVAAGSPAFEAGLQAGDRLVGINDFDCTNADMTEIKKRLLPPGREVHLTLLLFRFGELKRLRVRLRQMPEEQIEKIIQAHLRRSHSMSDEQIEQIVKAPPRGATTTGDQ